MADAGSLPEITVTPAKPDSPDPHDTDTVFVSAGLTEMLQNAIDAAASATRKPKESWVDDEICTLIVDGFEFGDWETIWIQIVVGQDYPRFRFTCAEREPYPFKTALLQFKPGDECMIKLGGKVVMMGVIITRQVAYDGKSHGVMLEGVGFTWYAARASIIDETGSYDDMDFLAIANKILSPTGIGMKVVGKVDMTPFKKVQAPKGETIFNFLDKLGRDRKVIVATDEKGNFVFLGDMTGVGGIVGDLVEGVNILAMQCVITDEDLNSEYFTDGATAGGDDKYGKDAGEQRARAPGTAKRYSPLLNVMEHPVWSNKEVQLRNRAEQMWHEGSKVEATVTVYGWFDRNHELWGIYQSVYVVSPMAILNMRMRIKAVTFTQDSKAGSRTTLQCVAPWRLNDDSDEFATSSATDTGQATTPPKFNPANPQGRLSDAEFAKQQQAELARRNATGQ